MADTWDYFDSEWVSTMINWEANSDVKAGLGEYVRSLGSLTADALARTLAVGGASPWFSLTRSRCMDRDCSHPYTGLNELHSIGD